MKRLFHRELWRSHPREICSPKLSGQLLARASLGRQRRRLQPPRTGGRVPSRVPALPFAPRGPGQPLPLSLNSPVLDSTLRGWRRLPRPTGSRRARPGRRLSRPRRGREAVCALGARRGAGARAAPQGPAAAATAAPGPDQAGPGP